MTRSATIVLATVLVSATILALSAALIGYAGSLRPASGFRAVDGDTVSVREQPKLLLLVGLDAPETGNRARCDAERALGEKAKARLQQLVNTGTTVKLREVPCSCPPGTLGTRQCNHGACMRKARRRQRRRFGDAHR
jgi:endonuclease YncB( thermonuclease family)